MIEQALADGYEVNALARSPDTVPTSHPQLRLVQGDVREAERVALVAAGSQAVASVLGPNSNTHDFVVSHGVNKILAAVKAHGVRRVVNSVGVGVRDPKDHSTLAHGLFDMSVKLLARLVSNDMLREAGEGRA